MVGSGPAPVAAGIDQRVWERSSLLREHWRATDIETILLTSLDVNQSKDPVVESISSEGVEDLTYHVAQLDSPSV
jgi:hypothetical protein